MKPTENEKRLLKSMDNFRNAYHELLMEIGHYEVDTNLSINDLPGFAESYPFDKSFDELPIDTWVTDVAERCGGIEYTVLNYEYLNTGGNTMVGIHEVWLPAENKTVYVYTNEEGCSISLVDYIRNCIDYEDSFSVNYCDIGRLTGYEKYFELYRHCFNQYLKDDCKYFGITRRLPMYLLSDELQKKVDVDYLVWSEAESDGCIPTNGVDIVEDPDYTSQFEDKVLVRLQEIKDWLSWHDNLVNKDTTDNELDELYDKYYELTFNSRTVRLPYDADVFNNISDLLSKIIKEW